MSLIENEKWLEASYEHLDGAIEDGNYQLAKDIIADAFDQGFTGDSYAMERKLRESKLGKFVKSSYPTI